MKIVQSMAAAAALMAIYSVAAAQEAKTGTVKQIDRLNGTMAIEQPPGGPTGGDGTVKQYKVQSLSLDELHAGDQVSFSATPSGDADTIVKIEKKK